MHTVLFLSLVQFSAVLDVPVLLWEESREPLSRPAAIVL